MVGDSDDVLFHAVPFPSKPALPPLCNDVDIADGTWIVDGWMLRLVGPLAAVIDDDIKFDVELAWLMADGWVVTDDVVETGSAWTDGDFGDTAAVVVDAVASAMEDECKDEALGACGREGKEIRD